MKDESEIIGNNKEIFQMYVRHNRLSSKNERVLYVFNNRTQDNLFKIFTDNIAIDNPINLNRANIDKSEQVNIMNILTVLGHIKKGLLKRKDFF